MKTYKTKEELDHARAEANRKVNLTYLVAGAYVQSLEITNDALDWAGLELIHKDKQLVKQIKQASEKLIWLIEKLQENSVLPMDEEDNLVHENTLHMFFATFMAIVESAGTDKYSDLRLYNLYNVIRRYPKKINFNFFKMKDNIAFDHIRQKISIDPNVMEDSEGNILVTENGKKKQILMKK